MYENLYYKATDLVLFTGKMSILLSGKNIVNARTLLVTSIVRLLPFLVADTQLYGRSFLSVRPSVRPSAHQSIHLSTRVEKWKNKHFRYLCEVRGTWGVYGGWMPLPTNTQQ